MERVPQNSGALLSHVFYADGVATAADGAVTVVVTKADGTTLTSGAATAVPGPPAYYTFSLAPQATLNHLRVTWTGTFSGVVVVQSDDVQIVGGFYLSEFEIRSLDASFALGASPEISDADLRRVRNEVEDAIEAEAGVAFVRRFARETLSGRGGSALLLGHLLPRTVYSLRAYTAAGTYTAFTAGELAAVTYEESGRIGSWSNTYAYGTANLVVEYEHGYDYPPPLIRSAARALFRRQMLGSVAATSSELDNVRSLSVEGYSRTWFEGVRTGSKTADDLIDQWKRSTTPAGVAIA